MLKRKIFFPEDLSKLKQGFDEFYAQSSLPSTRLGLVCALLLCILLGWVDNNKLQAHIVFFIICPAIMASLFFTYSKNFIKYGQLVLAISYGIVAMGFIGMINFTDTFGPAKSVYGAGLILSIIGASVVRMRRWEVLALSALILLMSFYIITNPIDRITFIPVILAGVIMALLSITATEKNLKDNYAASILLDNEKHNFKKLKERLEHSDTLKSKLLSIITHDLKGPTKNTAAILKLLNTNSIPREELETQLKKLETHMQSNLLLLENLHTWSLTKIDARTNIEPVNLHNLLEECITLIAESATRKGNKIFNEVEAVIINTDPDIIKMILRNILSNAVKFTENGVVTCTYTLTETHHRLTITDTGIGMSKECVDRLFDWSSRLSTRGTDDEKGAGIGLLISSEFLESLEGSIEINTNIEKGTSISIGLKR